MLVLTRKPDESIIINENICVKILGVHGSQVRLGITANPGVSVHREEIHQKILLERAAKHVPDA